jgi:DNA invertase Pin-like site-specific DNA recombinase
MPRKRRAAAAADGPPRLIGLIRVSTTKQEESGLGLEAQTATIESFRAMVGGVLLRTYTEVESGMHDDIESRPQLRAALADASLARARLVIAKLDRLVRSTSVMAAIKKSRVQFTACDLPNANELTIDIMVAVRAEEGRAISQRTRDALKAYRDGKRVSRRIREMYPDGVPADVAEATAGKLGASLPQCRNLMKGGAQGLGTFAAALARRRRAAEAYRHLEPLMLQLREDGLSLQAIADRLDELGHQTDGGCRFSRGQVKRVLDRLGSTRPDTRGRETTPELRVINGPHPRGSGTAGHTRPAAVATPATA